MSSKRILIGNISVDSGLIMVSDPSFFIGKQNIGNKKYKTWKSFLNIQDLLTSNIKTQMNFENGSKGLGIVFPTIGDGSFPIYTRLNKDGEPIELILKLK